jgi:hypothetical protein
MKLIDYKFDYRKYVLQKRQSAYNDIEQLIVRLGKKTININSNKPLHTFFIETNSNENPVHDFLAVLTTDLNKNIFWITRELHDKFLKLFNYLETYHMAKNEKGIITLSQLVDMGTISFEKIEAYRIEICTQFFQDIKELDEVDKFKMQKAHF